MTWAWGDLDTWGDLASWDQLTLPDGWSWGDLTTWGHLRLWDTLGNPAVGPITILPFDQPTSTLRVSAVAAPAMAHAGVGAATIQPRGSVAPSVAAIPVTIPTISPAVVLPSRVTVRAFDTATLTAWVTAPPDLTLPGYAVLIGGDVNPEAAGLVADGVPYLWFAADGTIIVEDGT